MKRHTSGAYTDCSLAVRSYAEALAAYFARMADQDRHHAQALYPLYLPREDQPIQEIQVSLSTFRVFDPRNAGDGGPEGAVKTALLALADAVLAERTFVERAQDLVDRGEYGFEDEFSLSGIIEVSRRRELEFIELYEQIEKDTYHGAQSPHECVYCGHMGNVWTDECPTCHKPFPFQERVSGYLPHRAEVQR